MWLIIIIIVIICILFLGFNKSTNNKKQQSNRQVTRQPTTPYVQKKSVRTTSHHNPIHVQTQRELINELPKDKQLDYKHLYDALDSLEDLINSYSEDINREQSHVENEIRERIQKASDDIKSRWESQAQKRKYRESLALHYASFTLADSIYEQMNKVSTMLSKIKNMNVDLGNQINTLSVRINNRTGNLGELKRQHKALCDKRHQISQIQKVYVNNLSVYRNQLDYQNILTAKYRDYIGANFGSQGRAWLDRLNSDRKSVV